MQKNILLVDDEPYHIRWIAENLEDDGYKTQFARNVNEALELIRNAKFRMILVDLNLPVIGSEAERAASLGDVYRVFPGLVVAREARNAGYRAKQVVLYSAHKESTVQEQADSLQIEYIVKGNTFHIMAAINEILSFDPTESKT